MKTVPEFLEEAIDGNRLFKDKISNIISLNNKKMYKEAVIEGLSLIGTKASLKLMKDAKKLSSSSTIERDKIKDDMLKLAKMVMDTVHYNSFLSAFPILNKKISLFKDVLSVKQLNGDDLKKINKLEQNLNNIIGKVVRANLNKEHAFKEAINKVIQGLSI